MNLMQAMCVVMLTMRPDTIIENVQEADQFYVKENCAQKNIQRSLTDGLLCEFVEKVIEKTEVFNRNGNRFEYCSHVNLDPIYYGTHVNINNDQEICDYEVYRTRVNNGFDTYYDYSEYPKITNCFKFEESLPLHQESINLNLKNVTNIEL